MNRIRLHRDDLEKILRIVDKLNPDNDREIQAGFVEVLEDNSSGIGSIIEIEIPIAIDNEYGYFRTTISGEENW